MADMDTAINEPEIWQRAFTQILDIWVTPEVERRQAAGTLPKPVELLTAQVIFYPDHRTNEVRINSEVKGLGKMNLKPGIEKQKGDRVCDHELDGIEDFRLSDDDDPDCGHITIIRINDSWLLSFDCIYNKRLSAEHINVADQFLKTANHALTNELWSPFVDCLFSAAELLAKSILLNSYSDPKFRAKANHRSIQSRFNRWAHLGNVDRSHANALNALARLRGSARYLTGDLSVEHSQAVEWLNAVSGMRECAIRNAKLNEPE